ncbi:unnamed protein product [Vitrella brassicaformis CCMP3155]|uniref:Uncharacterized protein n=1 Tax=Vitrella brassicaformis (strain CCMP3155) TaxID=1169540 RepID=A0A0G4GJL1_VITBC|nr:unnamed protein product [Vitrella brassicaformis CCMP3155]|eukprot:CEM30103.1 unnamed protein product [Vitrella brassicaformis CCMP3155]
MHPSGWRLSRRPQGTPRALRACGRKVGGHPRCGGSSGLPAGKTAPTSQEPTDEASLAPPSRPPTEPTSPAPKPDEEVANLRDAAVQRQPEGARMQYGTAPRLWAGDADTAQEDTRQEEEATPEPAAPPAGLSARRDSIDIAPRPKPEDTGEQEETTPKPAVPETAHQRGIGQGGREALAQAAQGGQQRRAAHHGAVTERSQQPAAGQRCRPQQHQHPQQEHPQKQHQRQEEQGPQPASPTDGVMADEPPTPTAAVTETATKAAATGNKKKMASVPTFYIQTRFYLIPRENVKGLSRDHPNTLAAVIEEFVSLGYGATIAIVNCGMLASRGQWRERPHRTRERTDIIRGYLTRQSSEADSLQKFLRVMRHLVGQSSEFDQLMSRVEEALEVSLPALAPEMAAASGSKQVQSLDQPLRTVINTDLKLEGTDWKIPPVIKWDSQDDLIGARSLSQFKDVNVQQMGRYPKHDTLRATSRQPETYWSSSNTSSVQRCVLRPFTIGQPRPWLPTFYIHSPILQSIARRLIHRNRFYKNMATKGRYQLDRMGGLVDECKVWAVWNILQEKKGHENQEWPLNKTARRERAKAKREQLEKEQQEQEAAKHGAHSRGAEPLSCPAEVRTHTYSACHRGGPRPTAGPPGRLQPLIPPKAGFHGWPEKSGTAPAAMKWVPIRAWKAAERTQRAKETRQRQQMHRCLHFISRRDFISYDEAAVCRYPQASAGRVVPKDEPTLTERRQATYDHDSGLTKNARKKRRKKIRKQQAKAKQGKEQPRLATIHEQGKEDGEAGGSSTVTYPKPEQAVPSPKAAALRERLQATYKQDSGLTKNARKKRCQKIRKQMAKADSLIVMPDPAVPPAKAATLAERLQATYEKDSGISKNARKQRRKKIRRQQAKADSLIVMLGEFLLWAEFMHTRRQSV